MTKKHEDGEFYTINTLAIPESDYVECAVAFIGGMFIVGYVLTEHPELGSVFIEPAGLQEKGEHRNIYIVPPEFMKWMIEHDIIESRNGGGSNTTRN